MYFRLARYEDIKIIHLLHKRRFFGSYLSQRSSLLYQLYRYFVVSKNFKVILLDDGDILGCVVIRIDNKFELNTAFFRTLLMMPIVKIYHQLIDKNVRGFTFRDRVHIQSIFSVKGGQGLGKLLVEKVEDECMKLGRYVITLETPFDNNRSVIDFYKRNGFDTDYLFYQGGRVMVKMYKLLKRVDDDSAE